jgi:hypothetical protein
MVSLTVIVEILLLGVLVVLSVTLSLDIDAKQVMLQQICQLVQRSVVIQSTMSKAQSVMMEI